MSKETRHITDVLGARKFYPDLEQIDFKDLIGKEITIEDAKVLKDLPGKFGKRDAVLIKFTAELADAEGTLGEAEATTISSHTVVVDQVKALLATKNAFPVVTTPTNNPIPEDGTEYFALD